VLILLHGGTNTRRKPLDDWRICVRSHLVLAAQYTSVPLPTSNAVSGRPLSMRN
jgi:hypothetical protein